MLKSSSSKFWEDTGPPEDLMPFPASPTPLAPSWAPVSTAGVPSHPSLACCSPCLYLQGGFSRQTGGKLAKAFRAQVIGREVEEGQARQSVQSSPQLSGTAVPQPVPRQAQLPECRVQLEGPKQGGELGLAQGQGAGAEQGAHALVLHGLQHLRVLPCKGTWCHQGQSWPVCPLKPVQPYSLPSPPAPSRRWAPCRLVVCRPVSAQEGPPHLSAWRLLEVPDFWPGPTSQL